MYAYTYVLARTLCILTHMYWLSVGNTVATVIFSAQHCLY